jgi:hypothetical protein
MFLFNAKVETCSNLQNPVFDVFVDLLSDPRCLLFAFSIQIDNRDIMEVLSDFVVGPTCHEKL